MPYVALGLRVEWGMVLACSTFFGGLRGMVTAQLFVGELFSAGMALGLLGQA